MSNTTAPNYTSTWTSGQQTQDWKIRSSTIATTTDPTAGSPIAVNSRKCIADLTNLCDTLREVTVEESGRRGYDRNQVLVAMEDAQARFKAWAVNIAALHSGNMRSSLDFRLMDAADMRRRTLKVLEDLQESLNAASLIICEACPNETWQVAGNDEIDKSDETSVHKHRSETSDLEQLVQAIKNGNASLMKLSMIIRNSPTRDDYLKAASRYSFESRYDIGHVKEKHGSRGANDWLLERLGKAITRRRQYLKYREDHHGKLSRDWEDFPKNNEPKNDKKPDKSIALTKATSFMEKIRVDNHDGSDIAGSLGSKTSYEATTIGEDSIDQLTVPQHPDMAFEGVPFEYGEPFRCPYCYTEQVVKNRTEWKKHVFRDLKPYVCTFKECDLRMFRSRHEWFAHELQLHRREWVCEYCSHRPFTTAVSFSTHLKSTHSAVIKGSQLKAIVLRSEEPVDKIPATACQLCDQWQIEVRGKIRDSEKLTFDGKKTEQYSTLAKFRKHLGRHMEQLALFALPIHKGREDEDLGWEKPEKEHSDLATVKDTLSESSGDEDGPSRYWIDGVDIDREFITTNICRYLGNDALVIPGMHQDQEGYYITSQRTATSAQLAQLRADSLKWQQEIQKNSAQIPGPQPKAPHFVILVGWWKCSECSREIDKTMNGDEKCPDCEHIKCPSCTDPFKGPDSW